MKGVYCALWTATDREGALAEGAVRSQVEFVRQRGVDGLLALGSTGEFVFLDLEVRKALLEVVMGASDGLPVVANISDVRPAVVRELAVTARRLGLGAVSVLPPFFYRVAQRDLIEFFLRVSDAAELPLILYNFPERTGNRIDVETVAAVADRTRLAAIKQSGNEFGYHCELVALGREKGFTVVTGSDTRLPEAMALGVSGCVSGLANAVPELVSRVYRALERGENDGASAEARRLSRIAEIIERLEFPLNVAAAIEARGLDPGVSKSIRSAETETRYSELVSELREWFVQWKLV